MERLDGKHRHYTLVCSLCGARQDDNGTTLECGGSHEPSLLFTEYSDSRFLPCQESGGLFRYRNWLPVESELHDPGRTIVYRSRALGRFLEMPNLWIAFSGYWPDRGATLETCTFKELEASTVLARSGKTATTLTIASAGNTAAAFALACSRNGIRCLIVIPERGLGRFRFRESLDPCVQLVVLEQAGYSDAIRFSDRVVANSDFHPEGGCKNVGRRDALATVMLSAFEEIQHLPEYYFQAVGSGTGGIAVHEASKRLRAAYGGDRGSLPRLMLCQNRPFTPIYDVWRSGRREWASKPEQQLRNAIAQVHADELTNWTPPYSVHGGLYDALTQSSGEVLTTDNDAAITARAMFEELEGVDIEPAPGVALACLRNALTEGLIPKDAVVLLNITGGGLKRAAREHDLVSASPDLRLTGRLSESRRAVDQVASLCRM